MPKVDLERLVWRCERKKITEEELHYHLREEARRLGDEFAYRDAQRAILRRWNPDLIKEFEEARNQAYKLFDHRKYKEALRQLKSAARSLAAMTLLVQSYTDVKSAKTDAAQLLELIRAESLRELPTIISIMRMIELAKGFMHDKQYGQASFVARFCRRQCGPLLHREQVATEKEQQLTDRLMQIGTVRARTAQWISDSAEDGVAMIEELQKLLSGGWLTLATNLIVDCEIRLAPRRRFHESYHRALNSGTIYPTTNARVEIDDLAKQRCWNAATQRLSETAMADCTQRLALLKARVISLASPDVAKGKEKETG